MRALDTSVLIFAEIRTSRHHHAALELLRGLADGPPPWAIPWPCIYEFLALVTDPAVFHPPMPLDLALEEIGGIVASPTLLMLYETGRHGEIMTRLLVGGAATGHLVHDAHIAALCLEHGVRELVTGDRDFHRFSGLRVTDPFAA